VKRRATKKTRRGAPAPTADGAAPATSFRRVVEILDAAVGGPSSPVSAHGPFWRGLTRDQFVQKRVFGRPLVAVGDGAGSNLVKALKGEAPFGSDTGTAGGAFRRMPGGRPPVSAAQIAEIQAWIDAGCPEEGGGPPPPTERLVYRIHPGIGIARVGSSPTEWFIGPEAPGVAPLPTGPFRDKHGLIKRQAARFRIYEYRYAMDGALAGVREVTAAEGEIVWTVRMANRKAAGVTFPPATAQPRNASVQDRASLVIDSGSQSVTGVRQAVTMAGKFKGRDVQLGEIRTDDAGRLVVLGGFGHSDYVGVPPRRIGHFANNDDWYDDVSDGPVTATVTLRGRGPVAADAGWVVVAPPKYAPEINSMVTLYDQALNAATRLDPAIVPSATSFTADIFPILKRVCDLQWVNDTARSGHGRGAAQHFMDPARLALLAEAGPATAANRRFIFDKIIPPRTPGGQGGAGMPILNDGLDPEEPSQTLEASLTALQYERMRKWALGAFVGDWPGSPPEPEPLDLLPVGRQPEALDRAALDFCIGGPFYPGIEGGYLFARADTYRAPFRIKESSEPGALTANMAVPWQADFVACGDEWWPAERPNQVLRDGVSNDWVPREFDALQMVDRWDRLGFIVREGDRYVEKERLEGQPPDHP
jgi:L-Lysine epsilon oxidase N-terminal/L-lysine epsilon oxidase C-terminal domain